jgi:hypothetical protein
MRPIGYRRILRAATTTILLAVPAARAGQVTVDLGTVGYTIGINASIMNTDFPADTETYTYQQLLFEGPLSMVVDSSGDTLAFVLTEDLGTANNGTLDYNFPFAFGASGGYVQTSPPTPGIADPGTVTLQAETVSGHQCPGDNTVGSIIALDPTQAALVYAAILGCDGFAPITENASYTATTVTLPPLGTVTNGDTTTTYIGEVTDYEWTLSAGDGAASATPEPSSLWLGASGLAVLGWRRFRRPSGQPAP